MFLLLAQISYQLSKLPLEVSLLKEFVCNRVC